MNASVLTVLLVIANVMGAGMIVPQVVRLHRSRSADGLSGIWVGVGIAMNCWWTAYGLAESLWGILPVSILAALLYLVMAGQYVGLLGRAGIRPILIGLFGLALLPVPFLLVSGWDAAGLVVGLAYAVQFTPAAVAAVRADDLRGVSPTTWTMAWIEAAIWVVYGISENDPALLVGGAGGAVASAVILFRIGLYLRAGDHPRSPPRGGPPVSDATASRLM